MYVDSQTNASSFRLRELIDAWEKRDADAVSALTAESTFNYLEREVARIAKSLDPYAGYGGIAV